MENYTDFILERLYDRQKIVLDRSERSYTCGRAGENHIVCSSALVSRKHCIFFRAKDNLFVTDLKSSNGVFINGVTQVPYDTIRLCENDMVGIGCPDIVSNDSTMFVYKVCTSRRSPPVEEKNSDVLSTINSNCNEVPKNNMSHTKRILGEKCKSDSIDCDTVVLCKVQKHVGNNKNDINADFSKADFHSFNPTPCCSKTVLEIKTEKDEDEIQVIQMFLNKGTTNKNVLNGNLTSARHFKDDKLDFVKTEATKPVSLKYDEMDVDEDNNKNNIYNENRRSTIEKESNYSVNKDDDPNARKEFNFTHIGDQVIKMECELQLTDDDEEAHSAIASSLESSNKQVSHSINPVKKEIKQEINMQYSECDYVNLDDDEDNIFPYSQLFDIEFDSSQDNKVEIKQECADNDIVKTELLNEEIIISDSEDEDNHNSWLERLSRSQVLKEKKELVSSEPIIKEELDLDVYQEEDVSNVIEPETSTFEISNKETSIETPIIKSEDKSEDEDETDIDSTHVLDSLHHKNEQETDAERENQIDSDKEIAVFNNASYDTKQSSVEKKQTKTLKKSIPIIEALPSHSRWSNKDKAPIAHKNKSLPKLTAEEKEAQKRKEKLDKEEQKCRRMKHKSLPLRRAILIDSISKEEKKVIAADRKEKLKKLAEEDKKKASNEIQNTKTAKPGVSKPGVKVSYKNRGDFLINEQKEKPGTSGIKTTKSPQKNNISKKTVNNVATSLQESLHLNNALDSIIKHKREDKAKDLNTTDEHSKGRRKDMTTSESRDKSTSMSMQKENFSPNKIKSNITSKPIKKVSFSEETMIRKYDIDPGHSLRKTVGRYADNIPKEKLAKPSTVPTAFSPKLQDYLLYIFEWNPVWLEEQRDRTEMPPILRQGELQSIKLNYESFEEYYKIAVPLLLLETWSTISTEFEIIEKNLLRPTVMCSIVENSITHNPIPSTNNFLTTFKLQILVGKEQLSKKAHPVRGDLVSFEYMKNGTNKQDFRKVFAYIEQINETVITDSTKYNKVLREHVHNPYAVITYTVLTRHLVDILVNRIQRCRTVVYLRTNTRMVRALQNLPQSPLMKLILNPVIEDYQLSSLNSSFLVMGSRELNAKQSEAVLKVTETILKKEAKLCFIEGPPGTGKSKVIVNLITQIWHGEKNNKYKKKILVCAPSNAAIDEIVMRLLDIRSTFPFKMVRVGRPENMHPRSKCISVTDLATRHLRNTADMLAVRPDLLDLVTPVEQEKASLEAKMNSFRNQLDCLQVTDEQKRTIKRKLNDVSARFDILKRGILFDDIHPKDRAKYERTFEDRFISGADIIACTLSSCYTNQMESMFGGHKEISACIVDEATQSCEAETLIPLMLGVNTLVLVGDKNQLPTTIQSQEAKKYRFDQSLFSRIRNVFELQKNSPIITLDIQYRMVHSIAYWPNKYFYDGQLKNCVNTGSPFPLYPYRILNHNSIQNIDKFANIDEAEFVANIIVTMMTYVTWDDSMPPISLGVLTPYQNQKHVLLNKINERMTLIPQNFKRRINFDVSVDGFEGQERDIVIMSCVRSNGIEFLTDRQKLCVALTRAKSSLILCGNFDTFLDYPMWKALLTDARSRKIFFNVNTDARPSAIKSFIAK